MKPKKNKSENTTNGKAFLNLKQKQKKKGSTTCQKLKLGAKIFGKSLSPHSSQNLHIFQKFKTREKHVPHKLAEIAEDKKIVFFQRAKKRPFLAFLDQIWKLPPKSEK